MAASKPIWTLTSGTGTCPIAMFSSSGSQPVAQPNGDRRDDQPGTANAHHDRSTLGHLLGV